MNPPKTYEQLAAENAELRIRLDEATETIQAIQTGQVDALVVVDGHRGHELYTLKTADQTYRVFIETMHEGAVTLSERGLVLYSNSTFAAMVSKPLAGIIGTAFSDYVIDRCQPDYEAFFGQSWAVPQKAELTLRQAGTELVCQCSATPLNLDEGHCLSLILTDLTAQKQTQALLESSNERLAHLNEALALSNQDLQRSNANLEQFAYVASHDLQEPLRKIQSFGDLLKHEYADQLGDGTEHLNRMQSAASRMSTLIKDLLSYSRISTRQESVAAVPLNPVLTAALTNLELLIQETAAVVTIEPLPTVFGDASQLEHLFQNLLGNALKFRRTDVVPQIMVRAQVIAAADLPSAVQPTRQVPVYYGIDVIDNGIGFDDKYVDRIFRLFQRLHGRNEFAGTGIGLAICEKVAANHGGAITATSQPGQGTTFRIFLPA